MTAEDGQRPEPTFVDVMERLALMTAPEEAQRARSVAAVDEGVDRLGSPELEVDRPDGAARD
jgi:hypothetical protein